MDAIVAFAAIVAGLVIGLVAFDFAALRWGTDSREPIGDDWKRRNPSWHH
jgi:hypothetical protein